MRYKVCPSCGAHLDPGEKCDCDQRDTPERELAQRLVKRKSLQDEYVERRWKEWFER